MNFQSLPPEKWQTEDVIAWLSSFGFEEYGDNFAEEKITGDFLLKYVNDIEVMKELGITKKVQRKRLEFEIEKLIEKQKSLSIRNNSTITTRSKRKRIQEVDDETPSEASSDNNSLPKQKKTKGASKTELTKGNHKKAATKKKKVKAKTKEKAKPEKDLSENYIDLPEIIFETSISNRSKCKNCEEKIEKSEMKFGVLSFFNRNGTLFPYHSWFHPQCGIQIISTEEILSTSENPLQTSRRASDGEEEEEGGEEEELPTIPLVKCKYCPKFFSDCEIQGHDHSYLFRIGLKHKTLLCHYCTELILSKGGENRLSLEEVQQLEGFQTQNQVVQKLILDLFTM